MSTNQIETIHWAYLEDRPNDLVKGIDAYGNGFWADYRTYLSQFVDTGNRNNIIDEILFEVVGWGEK